MESVMMSRSLDEDGANDNKYGSVADKRSNVFEEEMPSKVEQYLVQCDAMEDKDLKGSYSLLRFVLYSTCCSCFIPSPFGQFFTSGAAFTMADNNIDVFKMFAAEDRLDEDNYPMWAYMMQHVLVSKGVWNIVQGIDVRPGTVDVAEVVDVAGPSTRTAAARSVLPTAEQARWDVKDAQAHALIALSVKRTITPHIRSAKSAKQAWDILAGLYAGRNEAKIALLCKELESKIMNEEDDMTPSLLVSRISMSSLFLQRGRISRSPLEIVHSDIWGPCDHATPNGCRYFITFSDDYSRMTWVYFLKAKSEAFEVFLEFKVMVEKENGCHIKCLHTDGGGEYMSHSFDDYLREQGLRKQITCRYTPQQNGVAERKNRVIAEIARAMMNEMNMPLTYWAEAVHTAVHIMNQTPIAAIHEISPYERLYEIKPTVSYMKVFGCVCYVHVPNEARKKMEPKAVKCIFLGYPVEKKGYKCYDPTTRQVYVSRDVRFCEHELWYKPKPVRIEHEYEEQENVRCVVDESGPSTRTISGPHMTEESIGSVNPWSGRLRDRKQDEKGKKKMFEESSGDESFDEEHGLPHLRTPSSATIKTKTKEAAASGSSSSKERSNNKSRGRAHVAKEVPSSEDKNENTIVVVTDVL
ncbi:hypothetical protein L7F22_025053 [Adiantum nelumboides]|nr:hypothetical protein [Adiantum nelumboides]